MGDASVRIVGAADLRRCADDLRKASRTDLLKEVLRGIGRAVGPIRKAVRTAAGTHLPSGYAPVLLKSPLQLKTKSATGRTARVELTATAMGKGEKRDVASLDRGHLRHPLWGRRAHWFDTGVKAGFVSDTVKSELPLVKKEIGAAIDAVVAKLERG